MNQIFRASAPPSTHRRKATCKEVDCPHYVKGWITKIDINTELGKRQMQYIKYNSGRTFTEEYDGNFVIYKFHPSQTCFREHTITLDREPILLIKSGHDSKVAQAGEWHDAFNEASYKHQREVGN